MIGHATRLRVVGKRVPCWELHLRRFDRDTQDTITQIVGGLADGIHAIEWDRDERRGRVRSVARSLLVDDAPMELRPTPWPSGRGPLPKTPGGSVYGPLRVTGRTTLLVDPRHGIVESSVGAVVAWMDGTLVLPPLDASRCWSVTETLWAGTFPHRRRRIDPHHPALLVTNAVVGTCRVRGRNAFPTAVRRAMQEVFLASARVPSDQRPRP